MTLAETCRRKIAQNLLLLSKRNRAIIPVVNLKVETPMKEKPDVTAAGRRQLLAETREWEQTAAIIARFFQR